MIDQREYLLENKQLSCEINTDNWEEELTPGATVYITMVIKSRDTVSDGCCRECRATNIRRLGWDRKVEWYVDHHNIHKSHATPLTLTFLSVSIAVSYQTSSRRGRSAKCMTSARTL
jgi:hypothetical protein